jgi:hypothetical protein
MTAFRVVRGRNVLYLDTSLRPQLHEPNRLWQPGRLMGDTPDPHRSLTVVPLTRDQRYYGEPTVCLRCAYGEASGGRTYFTHSTENSEEPAFALQVLINK